METLQVGIALLLRWAHVLPAAIMVGAAIYARLAVMPTLEEVDDANRETIREGAAKRWSMMVGICAGLLLITGIINAGMNMTQFKFTIPGLYHGLVLVKFILALAVIYIASLLNGSSENAKEFRANGKFWLTLNCWLGVALVLIGGGMKLADRTVKTTIDGAPAPVTAPENPPAAAP